MELTEIHKDTTTDEDLWAFAVDHVLHPRPGVVEMALTEIAIRGNYSKLSVDDLKHSTDAFNVSSEKYSRIIIRLTWVLVALGALLLIATIIASAPVLGHWLK